MKKEKKVLLPFLFLSIVYAYFPPKDKSGEGQMLAGSIVYHMFLCNNINDADDERKKAKENDNDDDNNMKNISSRPFRGYRLQYRRDVKAKRFFFSSSALRASERKREREKEKTKATKTIKLQSM